MGSKIEWFSDDGSGIDSRLFRRMKRRSVSNKMSKDLCVVENNVDAVAKEVIAIDDDNDYKIYLDRKCSGIPKYVNLHDGRYDGDDTNIDESSGDVANKCVDDGNAEANNYADDEHAESSDARIDSEYKLFLDNVIVRRHDIVFSIDNEVIVYGQIDNDVECSCKKRIFDSRTVDTEVNGFQKRVRMRMSEVGNTNNVDQEVGPMNYHNRETESSKSKRDRTNKEANNCGMELDDNDPEYNFVLNSMSFHATYMEGVGGLLKKVRFSRDQNNRTDVEELRSNKQDKNSGVKLVDLSPQSDPLSSVAGDSRNKKSTTKFLKEAGCSKDKRNEPDEEVTILEWDPTSGGERTPFVSSKIYEVFVDDHKIPNSGRKASSEFMEELIKCLKKPYANNEYSQLLADVRRRKPLERDIDLRSGPKPFATKVMGKSYLDRHTDLRSKINAAKSDQLKVLNILRGFFFWLQNITREGAFQPWMDPSILEIKPSM